MVSSYSGYATKRSLSVLAASISVFALVAGMVLPSAAIAQTTTHTITASAGVGGSITPSGAVVVTEGVDQSFAILADSGFQIADVSVDGGSVGASASYTFASVTAPHTIDATFVAIPNLEVYVSTTGNDTTGDGTQTAPYATLAQAVSSSVAGATIHVASGTYVVASTITLNKAGMKLEGEGQPVLQVSGGTNAFMVSASGVSIQGFKIQKTDKTTQAIVHVAASDFSLVSNEFSGQYVFGDGEVSRALVIQGSLTGLAITGNRFSDLRQPAYVSGVTTGTVSGNHTERTRGWVLEQGDLTFTNNTWGTGSAANIYDIAIIPTMGATYYTSIPALSALNNNAFIEDQRSSPSTLSVVYVDAGVGVSGDGTARSPKKTLDEAVARVVSGGTIVLASDITTTAQFNITKALTLDGNDHTITAAFSGGSVVQITANNVTLKDLVVDGGTTSTVPTVNNRGINIYVVTGVLLDAVTATHNTKNGIVVNGSTVTVNNITTSGNGWEGIDVDLGGGVTSPAALTVNGVSLHEETKAAIRIDNITKAVSVTDTNSQYAVTSIGNIRDYYLNQKKVKTTVSSQQSGASASTTVTAEIPAGTTITANISWDGIVEAPTATTATVTIPGYEATVSSAIAVGSSLYDLTFDKAVKLTFTGQAGQHIGWFNHAGDFSVIDTTCTDNTQTTNDLLVSGGDCTIDSGGDLVVWTKHFSTFVTYGLRSTSGGGSGGSGGSSSNTTTGSVGSVATEGQVLGAETFNFTSNLTIGSRGDEVVELQQVLMTGGHLKIAAATGYFGPLTLAAVKLYQAAHGVPATGFVGPLTRAALNAAPEALTDGARLQKIVELLTQVLALQVKLAALAK